MNWLKRIGSRLKQLTQMVFGGNRSSWLRTTLPGTKFDYARQVGDGLGSSTIMAPVLWIARTLPEAPLAIEQPDGTLERDRPITQLLHRPNPFYSGTVLWWATAVALNLAGNAYWIKVRNGQGRPIELWWIPNYLIRPRWPDDGSAFISHYDYTPSGAAATIRLETDDVVHFRFGLDPSNVRMGLSPLTSVLREVYTDDEAANFTAALLRNAGVPGIIVAPEEVDIDEDDLEDTKEYIRQHYTGDKRGEPLVFGGPTKVMQAGFSPQQLDLSRLREIPEERVTAVLGIPAAVVGFGTGLQQTKVGATMRELREQAYESCIIPQQRMLADDLDAQLLADFETAPTARVRWDLSEVRVLQEDQNALATRQRELVAGGLITIAEGREPLGFDTLPEHDVYLRSLTIITVPAGASADDENALRRPEAAEPLAEVAALRLELQATKRAARKAVAASRRAAEDAAKHADDLARRLLEQPQQPIIIDRGPAPSSRELRIDRITRDEHGHLVGVDVLEKRRRLELERDEDGDLKAVGDGA